MSRKLCSVRTITDIVPIQNADKIELVRIDGWQVVSQKGIHKVGDQVLYIEVDAFLPKKDERFASFMREDKIKEFDGVEGVVIRTMKLRGVYSQGVILPVSLFPELKLNRTMVDIDAMLGVKLYEKEKEHTGWDYYGEMPHFIKKTEYDRIENCYEQLKAQYPSVPLVGTYKLDGKSTTLAFIKGKINDVSRKGLYNTFSLCSKTCELVQSENPAEQTVQQKAVQGWYTALEAIYKNTGRMLAIQGEVFGEGLRKNPEGISGVTARAFRMLDLKTNQLLPYNEFMAICVDYNILTTPCEYVDVMLGDTTMEQLQEFAAGVKTLNGKKIGEGLVFYPRFAYNSMLAFKVHNKKYLLKN